MTGESHDGGAQSCGFATPVDRSFGVIFDMDGVLVDSADAHFESWRRLGEELGQSITRAQFHATFGRQSRDIISLLFGPLPEDRRRAISDRKEEVYRDLVRAHPPIVLGAVRLVRELHEAGAGVAVGSSGPRPNIELILDAMGVRECIHAVVSGDDVTRGKPDPQVFLLAMERLELPPHRCVVIEDAPVGIQAAKDAGAYAVALVVHHPREAFDGADLIVPRLADLNVARLRSLITP